MEIYMSIGELLRANLMPEDVATALSWYGGLNKIGVEGMVAMRDYETYQLHHPTEAELAEIDRRRDLTYDNASEMFQDELMPPDMAIVRDWYDAADKIKVEGMMGTVRGVAYPLHHPNEAERAELDRYLPKFLNGMPWERDVITDVTGTDDEEDPSDKAPAGDDGSDDADHDEALSVDAGLLFGYVAARLFGDDGDEEARDDDDDREDDDQEDHEEVVDVDDRADGDEYDYQDDGDDDEELDDYDSYDDQDNYDGQDGYDYAEADDDFDDDY